MDHSQPHDSNAWPYNNTAANMHHMENQSPFFNSPPAPQIDPSYLNMAPPSNLASQSPSGQMYNRQNELSPDSTTWNGTTPAWTPGFVENPQYTTRGPYRSRPQSVYSESVGPGAETGYNPSVFSFKSDQEPQYPNQQSTGLEGELQVMVASQGPPQKKRQTSTTKSRISSLTGRGQRKAASVHNDADEPFACKLCGDRYRISSELKKHVLIHERPFTCAEGSCKNNAFGFTTRNDMERHEWGKHGRFPRSGIAHCWKCSLPGCEKKKMWTRPDNFRQHVRRLHFDPVDDAFVESCEITYTKYSETQFGMTTVHGGSRMIGPEDLPCAAENDWSAPELPTSSPTYDITSMDDSNYDIAHPYPISWPAPNQIPIPQPGSSYGSDYMAPSGGYTESLTARAISNQSQSASSSYTSASFVDDYASSYSETFSAQSPTARQKRTRSDEEYPSAPQHLDVPRHRKSQRGRTPLIHKSRPHKQPDILDVITELHQQNLPEQEFKTSLSQIFVARGIPIDPDAATMATSPTVNEPVSRNSSVSQVVGRTTSRGSRRVASSTRSHAAVEIIREPSRHRKEPLPAKQYACTEDNCQSSFDTNSALEKHRRRHKRPYACTHDKCPCSKTFGSKNDWKRHENRQHPMTDRYWRCGRCEGGLVFDSDQALGLHLHTAHEVDRSLLSKECAAGHVDVELNGQFWCGFCEAIQVLHSSGRQASDERFTHIALHFHPEGSKIEKWLLPDGRGTKTGLDEADGAGPTNYTVSHADESADESEEEEDNQDDEINIFGDFDIDFPDSQHADSAGNHFNVYSPSAFSECFKSREYARDQSQDADDARARAAGLELVKYCCQCKEEQVLTNVVTTCPGFRYDGPCGHQFCYNCKTNYKDKMVE